MFLLRDPELNVEIKDRLTLKTQESVCFDVTEICFNAFNSIVTLKVIFP